MEHRLPALDWMRGIAMILMASDHASFAFNANRLAADSVLLYDPQHELAALHFGFRWISHLCAPAFLFLAGTSLALSIERKKRRRISSRRIDRDLLARGLIILCVDVFIINWFWVSGLFLLQVMYAIGLAMILMIPLRRLSTRWLLAIALCVLVFGELLLGKTLVVPFEPLSVANTLLLHFGIIDTPIESIGLTDKIIVLYPAIPWWAMMAIGWAFGRYLLEDADGAHLGGSPARLLGLSGCVGLGAFLVLRGINAYGNMGLTRLDNSWVQWLHVSKYPPSLTFTTLELGLVALVLAWLFKAQDAVGTRIHVRDPVLLFGQTAFFFYLGHIIILEVAGRALGMYQNRGLLEAAIATVLVLVLLYPLCFWYRQYKGKHPQSFARFL